MEDKDLMRRCIQLARLAEGSTYPNPMVGSIIVYKGKIIGEGYHERAGKPHAEINAINSVEDKSVLEESEIFVSLEPCAHFGRTPPCALRLAEIKFKRVIIGCTDPNEKVAGKGIEILRAAGISVTQGILEEECRELNRRFFTYHQKRRPYIVLKWAQSSDGFIDQNHQPYQIGNAFTKQMVHRMRAEEQAILVGKNTAINDNPSLTVREVAGRNPVRILLDSKLAVAENFKVFNDEAPTLVFNSVKNDERGSVRFIKTESLNLDEIIEELYNDEIQSVIVEGGGQILGDFIRRNLWDEAVNIKRLDLQLHSGTPAPDFPFSPLKTEIFGNNTVEFYRNK